jgi:hypothetical protein
MLLDELSDDDSYCRVISLEWLEARAVELKEGEESESFGASIILDPDSDKIRN